MKQNILSILILLFLCTSCKAQVKTEDQESIKFDISPYSGGSNFVKNGVEVEDGFIVVGQKFTYTDSLTHRSAILKLNKDGEVQKEIFLGKERNPSSMLESIFKLENDRIFLLGENDNKLWVREIDRELNIKADTIFNASVNCLTEPHLFSCNGQLLVFANKDRSYDLFSVVVIDSKLENAENFPVSAENSSLDYLDYKIEDVFYDVKTNKAYILGGGCIEKDDEGYCKHLEHSILIYDPAIKNVERKIVLDKGYAFESLVVDQDRIVIASAFINKKEDSKNFDYLIQILSIEGEKKSDFKIDNYNNDHLKDMIIAGDEIILVGSAFDLKAERFFPVFIRANFDGEVLTNSVEMSEFKNESGWGSPHWEKALPLSNGDVLLLGEGDGWRVQLRSN